MLGAGPLEGVGFEGGAVGVQLVAPGGATAAGHAALAAFAEAGLDALGEHAALHLGHGRHDPAHHEAGGGDGFDLAAVEGGDGDALSGGEGDGGVGVGGVAAQAVDASDDDLGNGAGGDELEELLVAVSVSSATRLHVFEDVVDSCGSNAGPLVFQGCELFAAGGGDPHVANTRFRDLRHRRLCGFEERRLRCL